MSRDIKCDTIACCNALKQKMTISLRKLKAILLYFSNNTKYLGKIKLMKLLYFLDFEHTRQYGTPVTFDRYFHLEKGPIPSDIMNLIKEASMYKTSALSDTVEFATPPRTRMVKMIPVRKFTTKDAEVFSDSELKVLKEVTKRFSDATMEQIKEASHQEAPWLNTKMKQHVPYSLAGRDPNSKFTEEEIELSVKIVG